MLNDILAFARAAAEAGISVVSKAMELRQNQINAAAADQRRALVLRNAGLVLAIGGVAAVLIG
eukprot:SAG22_NODE_7460_length_737_cov_1.039185_1_plen_62_part_01